MVVSGACLTDRKIESMTAFWSEGGESSQSKTERDQQKLTKSYRRSLG